MSVEGSIQRGTDELVGGPLEEWRARFVAARERISCGNEACDSRGEPGVINLQGFVARKQGKSLKLVCSVCGKCSGGGVAEKMVEGAETVGVRAEGALMEETRESARVEGRCNGCSAVMGEVEALKVEMVKLREENARLRALLEGRDVAVQGTVEGARVQETVLEAEQEAVRESVLEAVQETVQETECTAENERPAGNPVEKRAERSKSWAEVARQSRPTLPSASVSKKVEESRKTMLSKGFLRAPEPRPVPVYFGGVQRGPIGEFKRCLFSTGALPKWAVLAVSFIGTSTAEIMCHGPLVNRLVATLKKIGFRYLPNFDARTAPTRLGDKVAACAACHRRWTKCAEDARGTSVKRAYSDLAKSVSVTVRSEAAQIIADSEDDDSSTRSMAIENSQQEGQEASD